MIRRSSRIPNSALKPNHLGITAASRPRLLRREVISRVHSFARHLGGLRRVVAGRDHAGEEAACAAADDEVDPDALARQRPLHADRRRRT
jgi:hypothetical protein